MRAPRYETCLTHRFEQEISWDSGTALCFYLALMVIHARIYISTETWLRGHFSQVARLKPNQKTLSFLMMFIECYMRTNNETITFTSGAVYVFRLISIFFISYCRPIHVILLYSMCMHLAYPDHNQARETPQIIIRWHTIYEKKI